VVATGIGGYWTQLVSGLVMAGSVVLNIVIGEGRLASLSARFKRWGVPVRSGPGDEASPPQTAP